MQRGPLFQTIYIRISLGEEHEQIVIHSPDIGGTGPPAKRSMQDHLLLLFCCESLMRYVQWYQHRLRLKNRVSENALCRFWVAPDVEFGVRCVIAYPCLRFPGRIRERGSKRNVSEVVTYSAAHNA